MVKSRVKIFSLIFIVCISQQVRANSDQCVGFGSTKFFQANHNNFISQCIENASEETLQRKFPDGNNVLMNAVVAGVNAKTLSLLLASYNDDLREKSLKHRNLKDLSLPHLAVTSSNGARLIMELSSWGADLNILKNNVPGGLITSDRGMSALHWAINERAPYDAILSLLSSGVDPTIQDRKGNIALNYAAAKDDRYDVLLLLLEWTKDLSGNDDGNNALHFAAQQILDVANMRLIMRLTASKYHDKVNDKDMTILHLAANQTKNPEILDVLMQYSQDFVCEQDEKNARAIDYARSNKNLIDTMQLLNLQNLCE